MATGINPQVQELLSNIKKVSAAFDKLDKQAAQSASGGLGKVALDIQSAAHALSTASNNIKVAANALKSASSKTGVGSAGGSHSGISRQPKVPPIPSLPMGPRQRLAMLQKA